LRDRIGQRRGVFQSRIAVAGVEHVAGVFARNDRRGVGVRGSDHHIGAGNADLPLDHPARGFDDVARQRQNVANDDRGLHAVAFDDQRLAVKIVQNAFGKPLAIITRQRRPVGRSHLFLNKSVGL
jgi:hypothetical protein